MKYLVKRNKKVGIGGERVLLYLSEIYKRDRDGRDCF